MTAGNKNIDQVSFLSKIFSVFSKIIISLGLHFASSFFLFDQVNQIRESLAIMGDNSTAFSLPQVSILS